MNTRAPERNTYEIAVEGDLVLRLQGANWMIALGSALESLGWVHDIDRMAMERLPNGTVLVSDMTNRVRYTIRRFEEAQMAASA